MSGERDEMTLAEWVACTPDVERARFLIIISMLEQRVAKAEAQLRATVDVLEAQRKWDSKRGAVWSKDLPERKLLEAITAFLWAGQAVKDQED